MLEKILLYEKGKEFIWSDGWWFDHGDIWFSAGDMNMLFNIKKDSKEAIYASKIPSMNTHEFRNYPRCLKKDNIIFLFPDEGDSILCYNLETSIWKRVDIDNPEKIRLSCMDIWAVQDKLYLLSVGLKKIIEFDIKSQEIIEYYCLQTKEVAGSVMVDKYIYIIDSFMTGIYKFNCEKKTIKKYILSGIDDHIKTICFDNQKFWLSGEKKKLYIWEENGNLIRMLDDFPIGFGIYNFSGNQRVLLDEQQENFDVPVFLYSAVTDKYVWFIPFQTNQIIYVDKITYEIKNFFLESEDQTEDDVKTQLLGHKYILLYVKGTRFLGLFSLKNRWVVEIDSEKLTYKVLNYKLSIESVNQILTEREKRKFFYEDKQSNLNYLIRYVLAIKRDMRISTDKVTIGKKIFSFLN